MSKFYTRDPLTENYYALYTAIMHPKVITPEQSFMLLRGKRKIVKPKRKAIPPKLVSEMEQLLGVDKVITYRVLAKVYNISIYKIFRAVKKYRQRGKVD